MMEHFAPEVALPVAGLLAAFYFLPDFARWNRARRATRKAIR